MSKKLALTLLISLLLISIFPSTVNAQEIEPIFKDGTIIWHSPVGTLRLILGQPGTGGWFSFPYLYTCFRDNILVWNFIDGYPHLIYRYHEPGARDIVMYNKYLLVQVKDGINIYEMDTPTTFVTYGGIYLPCDNGHLLWGTSQISPTVATVHVACPNGQIYGLHRWDFKSTSGFHSVDHPIPIPPMIWDRIIAVFQDKALVSTSIPLFLDIPKAICETQHYVVVTDNGDNVSIIHKTPPYKPVFSTSAKKAICGQEDTVALWHENRKPYNIIIWSNKNTSSITLTEPPTSIYGSYDHFLITTDRHVYLISTIPQFILNTSTLPEPATLQITASKILLLGKPTTKKTLWIGINKDKYYPTIPHTATKITRNIYTISSTLEIKRERSSNTYLIKHKNTIYIVNNMLYTLHGNLLHLHDVSIDFSDGTIWWISTGKVKYCHFSPSVLHFLDTLSAKIMDISPIWCFDTPQTITPTSGYPLYALIPIILFFLWVIAKIFKRQKRHHTSPTPPKKPRNKTKYFTKARKHRRKVWRYGS